MPEILPTRSLRFLFADSPPVLGQIGIIREAVSVSRLLIHLELLPCPGGEHFFFYNCTVRLLPPILHTVISCSSVSFAAIARRETQHTETHFRHGYRGRLANETSSNFNPLPVPPCETRRRVVPLSVLSKTAQTSIFRRANRILLSYLLILSDEACLRALELHFNSARKTCERRRMYR